MVRAQDVLLELIFHLKGEIYCLDDAQARIPDEGDTFHLYLGKVKLPLAHLEKLQLNSMALLI